MNKFSRFAILCALLIAALRVGSALAGCHAPSNGPAVTVDVREPSVIYRLSESAESLSARARDSGTMLGHGRVPLGLTIDQYWMQILLEVRGEPADSGYCARLWSAKIIVGSQPEVLVYGRFPAGTCQQRAILDHENEHVRVFREAVTHYFPVIDAALRQRLFSANTVTAEHEAEEVFTKTIRVIVAPLLDAIRSRAEEGNRSIDTAERYAEVFRRCPSW